MAKNISEDFDKLINEYQIKRYPNNRATIYDPNIISKRKIRRNGGSAGAGIGNACFGGGIGYIGGGVMPFLALAAGAIEKVSKKAETHHERKNIAHEQKSEDIKNDLTEIEDNVGIFYEAVCQLCDKKKMTETELYKKACISRAVFSKIRNMGRTKYIPKKNTIMQLCIALKLSGQQAQELLGLVGYRLSDKIKSDKIMAWCLEHTEFNGNVMKLNIYITEQLGESPFSVA